MTKGTLRGALDDVDYAVRKMGDGTTLLRGVFGELAENDPRHDQLTYLIEAQEMFRMQAAAAVEAAWQQVFAMEKAARS
jgi:hypothetical protein